MFRIIKQNDDVQKNIKEFVADTEADVADLPTSSNEVDPGSTCIVVATSNVYMLNNQKEWVKL